MQPGGGQLAVLQWARLQGCPWHWYVCTFAAWAGHLTALREARQHGCAWNAVPCSRSSQGGHLAILLWAHEHGCPWNEDKIREALHSRHLTLYLWTRRNGCPSHATTEAAAHVMVKAVTVSYLVLRSAAPSQVPHEVLRGIVMTGHELD